MKKTILFRVVFFTVAIIALSWLPQPVLAQHGGHGGGGGFHGGGGGGGGFHGGGGSYAGGRSGYGGGHSYGGYRGSYYGGRGGYHGGYRGGYYGGRGGYYGGYRGGYYGGRGGYGWGGRYWGRYGHGWGWGFGFGWPYWGWGWGYPYYYSPWYYDPYYSNPYYGPSDYPPSYPDPEDGNEDPPPVDPNARPQPNQNGPARSWRPPVPGGTANANGNVAAVSSSGLVLSVDRMSVTPASYRVARSIPERSTTARATPQADAQLRPEMQKALQRLREMPPFAREREIKTGRYSSFSPPEKELLRSVN